MCATAGTRFGAPLLVYDYILITHFFLFQIFNRESNPFDCTPRQNKKKGNRTTKRPLSPYLFHFRFLAAKSLDWFVLALPCIKYG